MSKKSDPSVALRSLLSARGSLDTVWDDLLGSVTQDSSARIARALLGDREFDDRSAALIFGAMLDQHLESAISAVLVSDPKRTKRLFSYDDKEGGGILSSLAAKVRMAYALGLYGEEMLDDLELLKLIRNVFAHAQVPVDFKHPAVASGCDALEIVKHLEKKAWTVGYRSRRVRPEMATARHKYSGAIAAMSHYLSLYEVRRHEGAPEAMLRTYRIMYGTAPPLLRKS